MGLGHSVYKTDDPQRCFIDRNPIIFGNTADLKDVSLCRLSNDKQYDPRFC